MHYLLSHARDVYATHDTSYIDTARLKHEKELETRIIVERSKNSGRKERGQEEEGLTQGLSCAKVSIPEHIITDDSVTPPN